MKILTVIALILTTIGAINWGLIGLFDFNLVSTIFGGDGGLFTKIVYILVGISGILNIRLLIELFED